VRGLLFAAWRRHPPFSAWPVTSTPPSLDGLEVRQRSLHPSVSRRVFPRIKILTEATYRRGGSVFMSSHQGVVMTVNRNQ